MTYREEAVATLGPTKKHCFACANIIDARAELCVKCGVRQPFLQGAMTAFPPPPPVLMLPPPPTTTKSKTTAGLLAFFLGGIGVHKFYLGSGGMGVLYLLFCWTLIPAFIAFIECLILFGMNDAEFARKYPG